MSGQSATPAAKTTDLRRASPPRLLFALLRQRFTGTLQLPQERPEPGPRTVWFEGGMPVFTDWVEPTEALGQVLMRLGMIDAVTLGTALQTMAARGGLLGETLIAMGAISSTQLRAGLVRQCSRKLTHVFSARDGLVRIFATQHSLTTLERVNVLELIRLGVAAHFDEARVSAELGTGLAHPVRATSAFARYREHFRFPIEDGPLLEAIVAGTTLDEQVRRGEPQLRIAQLLYTLWACQMLRIDAPVPRRASDSFAAMASDGSGPSFAAPDAMSSHAGSSFAAGVVASSDSQVDSAVTELGAEVEVEPNRTGPDPEVAAAFEQELREFETRLERNAHAFDLLGLKLDAGRKEIRHAWGELSKAFHPDALQARKLGHLRERVSAVFAALSEAHSILTNAEQREALKVRLERGENPADPNDPTAFARAVFESDMIAKEGDRYLKANRFDRALERYTAALALNPTEDDLKAASAWCTYCLSPRQRKDALSAEKALKEIVAESPNLARAHYFRGLVLRDLGNPGTAIAAFDEAIKHDPRLIDAERQVRAIRLQGGGSTPAKPSPEKKGRGLMGFFKR